MQAYVISLERSPQRLSSFLQHTKSTGLNDVFHFTPIPAVDGTKLDLSTLTHRVSESNLSQITRIRGILGCALSHLDCWRKIADGTDVAAIFEDDARLIDGINYTMVDAALRNLPSYLNLVWLNDYNLWAREDLKRKVRRKLAKVVGKTLLEARSVTFTAMPDVMTTTEAYIISPKFAKTLHDGLMNNLGACDRHMQLFIAKSGMRVLQSNPALFTQADRSDSTTHF
jgi:GR25 family glycosyltransferase involved in LPS biosynthesis